MLKNYFKTAFRKLWRNKTFTAINIVGLAVGMAVFFLIMEFVAFEWGANRFHKNYRQLYRVALSEKEDNPSYYLQSGLAPLLKEKFPAIQATVRVAAIGNGVISNTGADIKSFSEDNMVYVDGNFLQVFTFPVVNGTPSLQQPQTLALSERMAKKIFGTTAVSGKTVTVSNQFGNTPYTINAVFKDMPAQSDIQAEVLLSLNTLQNGANRNDNNWANPATLESRFATIYVSLQPGTDANKVAAQATSFARGLLTRSPGVSIFLQPFSELHLAPGFSYPFPTFGSLPLVALLLGVAVLILLIAWVNYINLSTVQALTRAKETGVRKVLGASKSQLAFQYLSETLLLTLAGMALAFCLVSIFQQLFNQFTGRTLSLRAFNQGWFWIICIAGILGGSLLSGGYVAFVLSSFKPVTTLRGKITGITKGLSLRKGLVVFQFSISIVFIIATILLYQQLQFMKTSNLGISFKQLLVVKGPAISAGKQKSIAFRNELAALPFVKKYAVSNNIPGQGYNFSTDGITKESPLKGDDKKSYNMFICDNNFLSTYNIELVQGKSFTGEDAYNGWSKARKVLINEKAATQLGFAKNENIVGRKILWEQEYEIAGVVKDYHHLSMHKPIEPVIFLPAVSYGYYSILTDPSNLPSKMAAIQTLYKQYFPGNPFEYFFADETYNNQYKAEQQLGNVFISAALVAIIIACMGLFGLAAFTAQQRIKEIGIRKVLGASVTDITQLLSRDFAMLVLIAAVIAFPVAWYAMHSWLQDYAYRININWWVFVIAGLAAMLIALVTVSFQAIKAAVSNPVKSLRSE